MLLDYIFLSNPLRNWFLPFFGNSWRYEYHQVFKWLLVLRVCSYWLFLFFRNPLVAFGPKAIYHGEFDLHPETPLKESRVSVPQSWITAYFLQFFLQFNFKSNTRKGFLVNFTLWSWPSWLSRPLLICKF